MLEELLRSGEGNPNEFCSQRCNGGTDTPISPYLARPIHVAVRCDQVPALRKLVEGHADPNMADATGVKAIHDATRLGNTEMVDMLVELRADLHQTTEAATSVVGRLHQSLIGVGAGRTPIDVARRNSGGNMVHHISGLRRKKFSTTNFKRVYDALAPALGQRFHATIPEVLAAVEGVINDFALAVPASNISADDQRTFLGNIRSACVNPEMLDPEEPVEVLVERLWTCAETCKGYEFCHMMNLLLCLDDHVENVTKLVRSLNTFCVTGPGRGPQLRPNRWPEENQVYRAGGMPDQHRNFFQTGFKFRAPRVVPASFTYNEDFAMRQEHPPVKWIFQLPPNRKCYQANYVKNRAVGVDEEDEFLFAAYSVFEVVSAIWSERPRETPHEIVLRVSVDNRDESDDLHTAPWC